MEFMSALAIAIVSTTSLFLGLLYSYLRVKKEVKEERINKEEITKEYYQKYVTSIERIFNPHQEKLDSVEKKVNNLEIDVNNHTMQIGELKTSDDKINERIDSMLLNKKIVTTRSK